MLEDWRVSITDLSCIWADCGLRAKIILDLLGDDLLVDIKIWYPVPILFSGRH